jgi:hypothetical protein
LKTAAEQQASQSNKHCAKQRESQREHQMIDVVLMIVGIGFFLLCWGYALACARI